MYRFRDFLWDLFTFGIILVAVTVLSSGCVNWCYGGISDCVDATCRVHAGQATGSGCAIAETKSLVWVMTNAHVVGHSSTVESVWWQRGHQSNRYPGRVLSRDREIDCALFTVEKKWFAGRLPTVIPLAQYAPRPNETILSVGCAGGNWASAWRGHVLGYEGMNMHFRPGPEGGRSGSAIFNGAGTHVVGLLKERDSSRVDPDRTRGIATHGLAIYARVYRPCTAEGMAERGRGEGGSSQSVQCYPWQRPQRRKPEPEPGYPSLPAPQIAPQADINIDLGPTNDRLDKLNANVQAVLDVIRLTPCEPPPSVDKDLEALRAADLAAKQEREKLGEAVEGTVEAVGVMQTKVTEVGAEQERLSREITQHGGLRMRMSERMDRVERQLGEDAGRIEKAKAYLKDWFQDRVKNDSLIGWIRTGVVLLVLVLVLCDVRNKIVDKDPLFIEKPRLHLERGRDRLRRIRGRIRKRFVDEEDEEDEEDAEIEAMVEELAEEKAEQKMATQTKV